MSAGKKKTDPGMRVGRAGADRKQLRLPAVRAISCSQWNGGFGAQSGPSLGDTTRRRSPPNPDVHGRGPQCLLHVDCVEDPPVVARALGICGAISEADSWLFAT
jgi:hypothetical protein